MHTLIETRGGYECTTCRAWWKKKPVSDCAGIRFFAGKWDVAFKNAESALGYMPMTARQLSAAGYAAGNKLPKPVAAVSNTSGFLYLYNPADAQPKRQMSDAQKTALNAAIKKMHYCKNCDEKLEYFDKGRGICHSCSAAKWAHDVLLTNNFCILDTETTGLYDAHAVELAVIDCAGNTLINTRLRPPVEIEADAVAIHGITADMVKDAPSFVEIYPSIVSAISGKPVFIYNASFDLDVLENMAQSAGLENPVESATCVMLMYAEFYGERRYYGRKYTDWDWRWQRLVGGDHTALGDCIATLNLIKHMATKYKG